MAAVNDSLPLIIADDLHNVVWYKISKAFKTHFEDYKVNKTVVWLCKKLKLIDRQQKKETKMLALSMLHTPMDKLNNETFSIPLKVPNQGGLIVTLYFTIALCKLYIQEGNISKAKAVICKYKTVLHEVESKNHALSTTSSFLIGCLTILAGSLVHLYITYPQ